MFLNASYFSLWVLFINSDLWLHIIFQNPNPCNTIIEETKKSFCSSEILNKPDNGEKSSDSYESRGDV